MYSGRGVVKHGIYQLSLSKGLTESDRSAMHQYTTLLSHLTVTALRPVRRGDWVTQKQIFHKWYSTADVDSDCTLRLQEES